MGTDERGKQHMLGRSKSGAINHDSKKKTHSQKRPLPDKNHPVIQSQQQTTKHTGNKRQKSEKNSHKQLVGKIQGEDDDDDEGLLAAAAAWASDRDVEQHPQTKRQGQRQDVTIKKSLSPASSASVLPEKYSLHITQLSFDCQDWDLRQHFAQAGCDVLSVRLVYDRYADTKTFRGVAFVDVADVDSYQIGLQQLHKSTLLGRRINVRQVKSTSELAAIVESTKIKVAQTIREQKEAKAEAKQKSTTNTKPQSDGKEKETNKSYWKSRGGKKHQKQSPKLTKQQRKRRAAIIMSLKRKKA